MNKFDIWKKLMHKNAINMLEGVKKILLWRIFERNLAKFFCGAFLSTFWPNCGAFRRKIISHTDSEMWSIANKRWSVKISQKISIFIICFSLNFEYDFKTKSKWKRVELYFGNWNGSESSQNMADGGIHLKIKNLKSTS